MNKLSMAIAAAAIIGLAGAASAHHKDDHDQGKGNAYGAVGCASPSAPVQGTPGHFFQQFEVNPHQQITGDNADNTVGQNLLPEFCPPPAWVVTE